MTRLRQIYFDGKKYSEYVISKNKLVDEKFVLFVKNLDMTPVTSLTFAGYDPNTYCDIKVAGISYNKVPTKYLFTEVKNKQNFLYPTANPGGLY